MLTRHDMPSWLWYVLTEASDDVYKHADILHRDVCWQCANLRAHLLYHSWRYYVLDDPTILDGDYDKLFKELEALEKQYQCLETQLSPTQRIGSPRQPEGGLHD